MPDDERNRLSLVNDLHVAVTGKMVEALVQSENRMRLRLDLLSEVVIELAADMTVTFLNKAWLKVGGRKKESVLGRSVLDLIDPRDQLAFTDCLASAARGEICDPITIQLLHPEKPQCWVECSIAPASEGWIGTMRDVTQAKRDFEQLQLLSLVANHTDNFVIITGADGRARWVNRAFSDFTGFTLHEIVGQVPGKVLQGSDTDAEEIQRIGSAIRDRQSVQSELLNYTRDGRPYWTTMHITPIFDDLGQLDSFISVQTDTTALHELTVQLAREKVKAESANEAKSQFLSNVSHEIRTPLNAVMGFLSILERTSLDGAQHSYVQKMDTAARHLLQLINDVLDFSKIEARMMQLDLARFDLGLLAQNVADIMAADCERKALELRVETAISPGRWIVGDEPKLRQVLLNLTNNAVKFTPTGHVGLSLRETDVGGGRVRIDFAVSDTGIGISEGQVDGIFSAFSQAEASTTRRFGGTGLGLSISQRLVHLMEGNIAVESQPGQGSTFAFSLTFPVAEPPRPAAASAPIAQADPRPLEGLQVLLAEDSELNQLLAQEILAYRGAQVVTAEDGLQAIEAVKTAPGRFDVVLMDLQMPVMDGVEATRHLRTLAPDLPIIAMTANTAPPDVERTRAAGMVGHVGKPFNADRLVDVILAAIRG